MRFWTVLLSFAVVAALALCTSAWAQPGPGGQPRPGGMFGGGSGASLSMLYGPLLNVPTVQKDLDLLDEQKAEIKPAGEKAQAAMRELFSGMRDLSQEQRQAKMEEIGKKMHLTRERIRQIKEKAIIRLRHSTRSKYLKGYVEE